MSLYEKPQPLRAKLLDPAEPRRVEHSSCKVGTLSAVLDEDMSKLSVDVPHHRKTSDSLGHLGAGLGKLKIEQNGPGEDGVHCTARVSVFSGHECLCLLFFLKLPFFRDLFQTPATDCGPPAGDLLKQGGGALMSDVALHSHVCEFCQAVFPGDSTTKGEFLRHLCTHVT